MVAEAFAPQTLLAARGASRVSGDEAYLLISNLNSSSRHLRSLNWQQTLRGITHRRHGPHTIETAVVLCGGGGHDVVRQYVIETGGLQIIEQILTDFLQCQHLNVFLTHDSHDIRGRGVALLGVQSHDASHVVICGSRGSNRLLGLV